MVLQQWKVVLWDLPQGGWGMSVANPTKEILVHWEQEFVLEE